MSSLISKAFRLFVTYINENTMVRHRYMVGKENLPSEDTLRIFVCNHQNTANDPININMALPERYNLTTMARADVFSIHPLVTRFLESLGIVPAFRADWEGLDNTANNLKSFEIITERVNQHRPLLVFPENGHTQGHYLDPFTTGAARIAFHIAKENEWKTDVLIVPMAHHYSDYFDIQADFLLSIGKPISIQPYYGEYQQHPYRVLRKIRDMMRESVRSMMLDMGSEDYEQKDFLRRSAINPATLQPMALPHRLEADKLFIKTLLESERYPEVISLAAELHDEEKRLGLDDITVAQRPSLASALLRALCLLVLLPLWIVSLWPNAVCYTLPLRLLRTDKMFTNSYRYLFSTYVIYPIATLVTIVLLWLYFGHPYIGIIWVVLWVPMARYTHRYYKQWLILRQAFRYALHRSKLSKIEDLRKKLKEILKIRTNGGLYT